MKGVAAGLAIASCVVVVLAAAGEAGFRMIDGYKMSSLQLAPATAPVKGTIEKLRADLRHADGVALAHGVDRAWYGEEPAPVADIPFTREQEQRYRRYPSDPVGAFALWNPNYLRRELCAGQTRGSLGLLDDFNVFTPVEDTPYPSYVHPAHFTFPGYITTNGLGWRGPEISRRRERSVIRIAFVGASTTVSDERFSHPEYVGFWLNRWAAARRLPYRFEVINAGETGIDSNSIAAIVRQDLASLDVDLVIYYEGANEFAPSATTRITSRRVPPRPSVSFTPPSAIETHSDIARRAMIAWRSVRGGDGAEAVKPEYEVVWPAGRSESDPDITQPDLPMGLDHTIANLESLRAAEEASGGEVAMSSFIWMVYPGMRLTLPQHLTLYRYLNEVFWPASYAQMRRMADYQNRAFHAFAARHHLEYFDVASAFPRDPDLFNDGVHMTGDGLRLLAWIYLQRIVELVERRVADGRWPRPSRTDAPADRLRAGARLVRRDDLLRQCH